jgi:hypothetical protein
MSRTILNQFRLAPLALVIVSTLATACAGGGPTSPSSGTSGGGSPTSPSAPAPAPADLVTGFYRLAAVNSRPVPGVVESVSLGAGVEMAIEAVAGEIRMNGDGTYLHAFELRLHSTIAPTRVFAIAAGGTYSVSNGRLTLTPLNSRPYEPHYAPGQIEIQTEVPGLDGTPEVFIFTYRK